MPALILTAIIAFVTGVACAPLFKRRHVASGFPFRVRAWPAPPEKPRNAWRVAPGHAVRAGAMVSVDTLGMVRPAALFSPDEPDWSREETTRGDIPDLSGMHRQGEV